jgi:predicted dehydrogenase
MMAVRQESLRSSADDAANSDVVRVGVVGYGYWGPKVARNLTAIAHSRLAWIADLSQECRARAKAQFPWVRTTGDVDELLGSDVDAVVIATPIRSHHRLARAAMLAGKHVMVEKPLTASAAEAEDLVSLAEAHGRKLMVGHTFEYNPAIRALREIVASGEIGDVYYVSAARLNLGLCRTDINVLWDLAPHDLSILRFVLGSDPVAVSARGGASVTPGVHDVAFLELRFPGDILAHVHVSWLDPCKVRRVTVAGSRKMVVCDDLEPVEKIRIYDKRVERPLDGGTGPLGGFTYWDGGATAPELPAVEPLRVQCQQFVDCIRLGFTPQTDGRSGLNVVRVLERADASLRNGGLREVLPAFAYATSGWRDLRPAEAARAPLMAPVEPEREAQIEPLGTVTLTPAELDQVAVAGAQHGD